MRPLILLFLIVLICLGMTGEAKAQTRLAAQGLPKFDSLTTVEDYVAYATSNRSGLKASYEQWQESVAMSGSAGALDNPLLSYEYGYTKFSDPVGPQRQ